ncbi:MAG: hypothetical protein QXI95_02545 [Candidatus Micrarchaeaceae archaeon]
MADYVASLKKFVAAGKLLACPVCGAETISIGENGICSNCEMEISKTKKELEADAEAYEKLNSYMLFIGENDYGSAINAYEELAANRGLQYRYMQGLNYIKWSNYEASLVNYEGKGFIEDNAIHAEASIEHYSRARLIMHEVIAKAENEQGNAYVAFMASMQLRDAAQASFWLDRIESENGSFLHSYAEIAYKSLIGDFNGVLAKAEELAKSKSYPFTLYYYATLALFRLGKYKEAKNLAAEMNKHASMANLKKITGYIEKVLEKP